MRLRTIGLPVVASSVFYNNLNDHNKGLLNYNYQGFYTGNVVDSAMKKW